MSGLRQRACGPTARLPAAKAAAAATVLLAACAALIACDGDDASAGDARSDAAPERDGSAPHDAGAHGDAASSDAAADAAADGGASADPCAEPATIAHALRIEAPAEPPPGLPFTVAVSTASGAPVSADATLCLDGAAAAELHLYRGRGSAALSLPTTGEVTVRVAAAGDAFGERVLRVVERPSRTVSGTLGDAELSWPPSADVVVEGDLVVPVGSTLVIEAGTRVLLAENAALQIDGALRVRGSADDPVLFTRAGEPAWGGIRVSAGGSAELEHAWLTAGGGDDTRAFGHSNSQPVLFASESRLTMTGGGVVDNVGKAFGAELARVRLDGVLVSRCDTGGQLNASDVLLQNAHVLELPDADGRLDDDDNDGIYLSAVMLDAAGAPVESIIRDTVFALGEDDAIDHNNAQLRVERVWIEGFTHEGVAGSTGHRVLVRDSVVRGCEQGIEAGYGAPEVVVEHCLVTDNDVGLRFGDSYDDETTGTLTVSHTISLGNRSAEVRNHVNMIGGPSEGAIAIACSMVGGGEASTENGNAAGEPAGDYRTRGCATGPDMDAPGCDGTPPGPRLCF